jgi:hypothetical protein
MEILMWRRYRFHTKSLEDYRPLIFNPDYPWWCSGGMDNSHVTIVAYLPSDEDLLKYWDDAYNIEFTEEPEVGFTTRFPKPDYFTSEGVNPTGWDIN